MIPPMRTLMLGVFVALVATACSLPANGPDVSIPTGCGDCTAEVADVQSALQELPEVSSVDRLDFSKQFEDRATLFVDLTLVARDIADTDTAAIQAVIGRVLWESGVDPMDVAFVSARLQSGYVDTEQFDFSRERADYDEQWGERPQGAIWSSPIADPEPGCGVCTDESREIAKAVSGLPGVRVVREASFVAESPTNGTSFDVAVTARDDSEVTNPLVESIAQVVWRSRVTPMEWISVSVLGPDTERIEDYFAVDPSSGDQYDEFLAKWGERPVG